MRVVLSERQSNLSLRLMNAGVFNMIKHQTEWNPFIWRSTQTEFWNQILRLPTPCIINFSSWEFKWCLFAARRTMFWLKVFELIGMSLVRILSQDVEEIFFKRGIMWSLSIRFIPHNTGSFKLWIQSAFLPSLRYPHVLKNLELQQPDDAPQPCQLQHLERSQGSWLQ